MTKEKMAAAFNEWMRRYIEEPERFLREWQSIQDFNATRRKKKIPTYGSACADYLHELMNSNIVGRKRA